MKETKEQIKEKLNYYRNIFSILLITEISLISWLCVNYKRINKLWILLTILTLIFISLLVYMLNRKILNKINKLGELE